MARGPASRSALLGPYCHGPCSADRRGPSRRTPSVLMIRNGVAGTAIAGHSAAKRPPSPAAAQPTQHVGHDDDRQHDPDPGQHRVLPICVSELLAARSASADMHLIRQTVRGAAMGTAGAKCLPPGHPTSALSDGCEDSRFCTLRRRLIWQERPVSPSLNWLAGTINGLYGPGVTAAQRWVLTREHGPARMGASERRGSSRSHVRGLR